MQAISSNLVSTSKEDVLKGISLAEDFNAVLSEKISFLKISDVNNLRIKFEKEYF